MRAIALSGMMAAGKSTVCSHLHSDHGFTVLAFGDVVRAEADRRGVDRSNRAALQSLGQALFHELGANGLVDHLLVDINEDVAVDGVRHLAVLERLRDRLPTLVYAFLQADHAVLDRRWQLRGDSVARIQVATHEVEAELRELRDRADVVFNTGSLTAPTIAAMLSTGSGSRSSESQGGNAERR